jgi:glycosyltransferase involved in cell wall biosynthesis
MHQKGKSSKIQLNWIQQIFMNILHCVESYPPALSGMPEYVRQVSEYLVRFGHQVTVATSVHSQRQDKVLNGVRIEEFQIEGNEVIGYSAPPGEINRYLNFLRNSDFDIVTLFAAEEWAVDLALSIIKEIRAKRKVFAPNGFSNLFEYAYRHYFEKMKTWLREFDSNIFNSYDYRDINFARENGINKWVVIPNGASEEDFLPESNINIRKILGIDPDSFLILHIGTHEPRKGHDAAIAIFKEVPIQNATFLIIGIYGKETPLELFDNNIKKTFSRFLAIVKKISLLLGVRGREGALTRFITFLINIISGSNLPKLALKKIAGKYWNAIRFLLISAMLDKEKCPASCKKAETTFNRSPNRREDHKKLLIRTIPREQAIAAYKQSDIFLFPSSLECSPIVLYECLAAGLPFLTSNVGNAKEIIAWTNGGMLLPTYTNNRGWSTVDIPKSVKMLKEIYDDSEKRNHMSEAGFTAWQERFTWEKITRVYEKLYLSLLANESIENTFGY